MDKSEIIEIYDLPTVDNVCNQILREVISLPKVSMAHVIMNPKNVSLWHRHSRMSEVYFILSGEGVLYYGDRALKVKKGAHLVLPPKTPHKLKNTGKKDLVHLVFAVPPFDSEDVELLKESSQTNKSQIKTFKQDQAPIMAQDGAEIYELISNKERKALDVALAVGLLPPNRKAVSHLHKVSEEVYYIISGKGKIKVGNIDYKVRADSVVHVPINAVHALENESGSEDLEVLCLSSPAYSDEDFILK
ncbi:cupin domain-containing protein [Patescibacteria group bacterium]